MNLDYSIDQINELIRENEKIRKYFTKDVSPRFSDCIYSKKIHISKFFDFFEMARFDIMYSFCDFYKKKFIADETVDLGKFVVVRVQCESFEDINMPINGDVKIITALIIHQKPLLEFEQIACTHQNCLPLIKANIKIAIVGCGRINKEILLFVKNVIKKIKKVYLFDLSEDRMDNFISLHHGTDYEFEKCASIEELFAKTKLVSFATTAGVPFVENIEALTAEHTILGISLRDLAPTVIEKAYNIVDDYDHVCRERTSIHLTYQKLKNADFIAGNIADVISNSISARDSNKAVIYSPFGLGVLDLSLSNYVYQSATKDNIGTVVENFLP